MSEVCSGRNIRPVKNGLYVHRDRWAGNKLLALVYDILPPTSAIVHYAVGLEKLSVTNNFSMTLKRE